MENNILDELLSKIKTLENLNTKLFQDIDTLKVTLQDGPKYEIDSENDSNNLSSKPTKEEKLNNLENIEEVLINYIHFDDQINNLWILGDFTDWEPKQMKRGVENFFFNIILIKGFKYYFTFTERNEMIIDYNTKYEINPRTNQTQNFIELQSKNTMNIALFDSKINKQFLIEAKKNFMMAKIENEEEVQALEEMKTFSNKYRSKVDKLSEQKENDRNRIKRFYESKQSKIKASQEVNVSLQTNVFKKRIILDTTTNTYYYLDCVSLSDNFMKVMRLYDSNSIKINLIDYYIKKNVFQSFPMKNFNKQYRLLSVEEGENILKDYNDSEKILKIFYSTEEREELPGILLSYHPGERGKKYTVQSILPEGINIEDYDIDYFNGISDVRNRRENLKVLFKAEEIKNEFESLAPSLKIYYNIFEKTINLLHVHCLDPSIDISNGLEVFHLDRNENTINYKNFENKSIKIKILFQNFKLHKIFQNILDFEGKHITKEIKGEEFILKSEKLVQIKSESKLTAYYVGYYAKIKKLPIGILAQIKNTEPVKTKEDDYAVNYENYEYQGLICEESNKSVVSLNGYIDLEIIFDEEEKYLDPNLNLSLPVCLLSMLDKNKEVQLDGKAYDEKKNRSADQIQQFEKLCEDLDNNFTKYMNDFNSINNLSKEEIKKSIEILEKYKNIIHVVGAYVEQKEMWTYLEVIINYVT